MTVPVSSPGTGKVEQKEKISIQACTSSSMSFNIYGLILNYTLVCAKCAILNEGWDYTDWMTWYSVMSLL